MSLVDGSILPANSQMSSKTIAALPQVGGGAALWRTRSYAATTQTPQFVALRRLSRQPLSLERIKPRRSLIGVPELWARTMPSLLHISDLHRTSDPRPSNEQLLTAIASDATRWSAEGIPQPDLIVVSGDLIQGAAPGSIDADAVIAAQYGEADDFLRRLAAEFVDEDLGRVVVVPGNHDVSWDRARGAMQPATACPDGIARKSLEPESRIRWDWDSQQALEIVDDNAYESRLDPFRCFRAALYAGVDPNPLAYGDDIVFFDYPDLDLAVVGFASWHGNDCYCEVGEIDPQQVAKSRELLKQSAASTAVAVWHHSLVGGPRARDYMDQRVTHQLIDFGFGLALHGHQHYPGAAPYELRLPNLTSMTVVGAGSLAVGDGGLPMGERRQFNVVVLDPHEEKVTVNVRAMSREGVFMGSHRDDFGGNTFVSLPLPRSPVRPEAPSALLRLDDAFAAVEGADYARALELVEDLGPAHAVQRRQIQVEALCGLGNNDEVLALLNPPQSVEDVIRVLSMLLERQQFDEAEEWLSAAAPLLDGGTANDLASVIKARRMAS